MSRLLPRLISAGTFVLLGSMLSGQWLLAHTYFGKDYIHWGISLLIIAFIIMKMAGHIQPKWYALPVFLLLVSFSYAISFELHTFPTFSTLGDYIVLVIATSLLIGSQRDQYPFNYWLQAVLVGAGISLGAMLDPQSVVWIGAISLALLAVISAFTNSVSNNKIQSGGFVLVILVIILFRSYTVVYPAQKKYFDPVIFSTTTAFQQIDITQWKGQQWYYLDQRVQFSTVDPWLYYEPLVHPAMSLLDHPQRVLILGGENGMALSELLKYSQIETIDLIPLDTALLTLAASNTLFTKVNKNALKSGRIHILTADLMYQLAHMKEQYDLIVIDLPDPKDVLTNQYYTKEFYQLCLTALSDHGVIVTQSGSPYFATEAFGLIANSMKAAGFQTTQLHNQIMTAGEWGWTIGVTGLLEVDSLLRQASFDQVDTHWLNQDAMQMMLSFGQRQITPNTKAVNTMSRPILYRSYNAGNWQHR